MQIFRATWPLKISGHRKKSGAVTWMVSLIFGCFFTFRIKSFRPTKPSGQRVSLTGWGYHFSVDLFVCNKTCHLGLTWGEDMIFSDSKPQESMEQNTKGFTGGLEN